MFRRLFRRIAPLTGASATRRVKNYSARSGFVYVYRYAGRRACRGGMEYVFDVSEGPAPFGPVAVRLPSEALRAWEISHRPLRDPERYAVVKMALFQAFDQGGKIDRVTVTAADAVGHLKSLGID